MIAFEVLPVNRVNKFYCLMGTWRVSSQLLGTHDAMVALAILSPVFFPVWNNPPATRSPALRQRHRELHFYVVHPYRNGEGCDALPTSTHATRNAKTSAAQVCVSRNSLIQHQAHGRDRGLRRLSGAMATWLHA